MKKRVIFGVGLACLACCAPLLAPMLAAGGVFGAGGWLGGLDWAEIACLVLVAALAAGAVVIVIRRHRRAEAPYCEVKE